MGWITPIELTEATTVKDWKSTDRGGTGLKIVNNVESSEYYIVETIDESGWNKGVCKYENEDETRFQEKSNHHHDAGDHDCGGGVSQLCGKIRSAGADTYEAGATKISDSDIYSENQAVSGSVADGEYEEIASFDDPGEGDPLAAGSEEGTAQGAADGEEASADNPAVDNPGEAVLTGGTGVAEYIAMYSSAVNRSAPRTAKH